MRNIRLVIIAIFMVIGGFILGSGAVKDIVINGKDSIDLNYTNILNVEMNQKVEMDVDWIVGYCASGYTEHSYNGRVTSVDEDTERYYVTSAFDDAGEEYYYIIKVKPRDYSAFETVEEETWAYMTGEDESYGYTPFSVTMKTTDFDDDIMDYMVDFIDEFGIYENASEAEIMTHIAPIQLEDIDVKTDYLALLGAFALVVVGGGLLFILLIGVKKGKKNNYPVNNGIPGQPVPNSTANSNYGYASGSGYSQDGYNQNGEYVQTGGYNQNGEYIQNTSYGQDMYQQSGAAGMGVPQNNVPGYSTGSFGSNRDEDRLIKINQVEYRKTELERVNRYVVAGDIENAVRELQYISGMDQAAAESVIMDWNCYMN